MDENELLKRITVEPKNLGDNPTIRGRRLAVELQAGEIVTIDPNRVRVRPPDKEKG